MTLTSLLATTTAASTLAAFGLVWSQFSVTPAQVMASSIEVPLAIERVLLGSWASAVSGTSNVSGPGLVVGATGTSGDLTSADSNSIITVQNTGDVPLTFSSSGTSFSRTVQPGQSTGVVVSGTVSYVADAGSGGMRFVWIVRP